LNAWSTWKNRW